MGYQARTGEQPVEPADAEDSGAPLAQAEVDAGLRPPTDSGDLPDLVTEDDGSGVAGGSSGSSGGGSSMPGHPDATR
jgi:hypothetical protein